MGAGQINKASMVSIFNHCLLVWLLVSSMSIANDMTNTQNKPKIPIVYSKHYDITFWGLQHLHPFDTQKYSKIYKYLVKDLGIPKSAFYSPKPVTKENILLVHTREYLKSLNDSKVLATIGEMPVLSPIPNKLLQRNLLMPMKYATGGTILGVKLALEYGWTINLGGGYHHAKKNKGEGFSYISDIAIAIEKLWQDDSTSKVMVIDLDAHQGNGVETIFEKDPRVYVFDIYNVDIYPRDLTAKMYIDKNLPVQTGIRDKAYLDLLVGNIHNSIDEFQPDLIIYNAGTDIYFQDPLGAMDISEQGIIKRDEIVFKAAISKNIPILMLLSGGYTKESARIIGESIKNIISSQQLVKRNYILMLADQVMMENGFSLRDYRKYVTVDDVHYFVIYSKTEGIDFHKLGSFEHTITIRKSDMEIVNIRLEQ